MSFDGRLLHGSPTDLADTSTSPQHSKDAKKGDSEHTDANPHFNMKTEPNFNA